MKTLCRYIEKNDAKLVVPPRDPVDFALEIAVSDWTDSPLAIARKVLEDFGIVTWVKGEYRYAVLLEYQSRVQVTPDGGVFPANHNFTVCSPYS